MVHVKVSQSVNQVVECGSCAVKNSIYQELVYTHQYMHLHRQTDRGTDKETDRQKDIQTDRQRDRQPDRQTVKVEYP